jgi:hypothetical protein
MIHHEGWKSAESANILFFEKLNFCRYWGLNSVLCACHLSQATSPKIEFLNTSLPTNKSKDGQWFCKIPIKKTWQIFMGEKAEFPKVKSM